jgi:amino acid efflux transporter
MYVAAVLGPGVLTLPGLAERVAGSSALLAWAALIALSWPIAATFARLGVRRPGASGVLDYCAAVFGRRFAVGVGRCFWFAIPVGTPAAALMAGGYVGAVTGSGRVASAVMGIGLTVVVAAVNLGRVATTARLQLVLSGVLAVFLVLCTAGSLSEANAANLQPFAPHGVGGVVRAVGVLVWGFAGWEAVASLSGEFRDRARDIVVAARRAVIVIGVLYAGVALAVTSVLGPAAGTEQAPLAGLLQQAMARNAAHAVAAAVAVALTAGVMNAYFAGAAHLTARLASAGGLPRWLASADDERTRRRRSVLTLAGLSTAGILLAAAARLDLLMLVSATSALLAVVCAACVYAAWVMARQDGRGGLVEAAASLGSVVMALAAGPFLVVPAAVILVPAVGNYAVRVAARLRRAPRRRPGRRLGV